MRLEHQLKQNTVKWDRVTQSFLKLGYMRISYCVLNLAVKLGMLKYQRYESCWTNERQEGSDEEAVAQVRAVGGFIQIWVKREDGRPPPEGLEPHVRTQLKNLMTGSKAGEPKAKI